MMSRIQITDGLGQRYRGVVAHSELATPDAVVDMGRTELGIDPSQMRTGRVLHRGVKSVATDGGLPMGKRNTPILEAEEHHHVCCRECTFEGVTGHAESAKMAAEIHTATYGHENDYGRIDQ